jgi:hypothetical protein
MQNVRAERVVFLVSLLFSLTWVTSCGGGGGAAPPPTPSIAVSITPSSANPLLGNTQQFNATVTGTSNSAVTWSVNGVTGGNNTVGTVSNAGLYTAPQRLPSPATVTVKAASQADTSKSASASVMVTSDIAISIATSPAGVASIVCGASIQMSAAISSAGDPDNAVTWSVNGVVGGNASVGTVSESGLYTAPSAVPSPATVTVVATSVADPAKSASTTVTIVAPQVAVTISPTSATAQTGDIVQFTVAVTGTDNPEVAWSVNDNVGGNPTTGTISISGLYTAPAAVPDPRTVTVKATSVDQPSASAAATVLINPPCQVRAGAMTDTNGLASICSGGFTLPIQVVDEDTGIPISSSLATAVAVDPTRPGRAIVLIADPSEQYPFQFVILESPRQSTGPALSKSSRFVSESSTTVSIPARRGTGTVITAVRSALDVAQTAILGDLPPPQGNPEDFADLFVLGAGNLTAPPGLFLPQQLRGLVEYSVSEPLDIDQYLSDTTEELAMAAISHGTLDLVTAAFIHTPPAEIPGVAIQQLELSSYLVKNAACLYYEREGATQVVKQTIKIGLVSVQFPVLPYEQLEDPSKLFPERPTAHFAVTDPEGAPSSEGSLELISKDALGLGIVAVLDTQGKADIPVPVGDYQMRVAKRGYAPVTQDVSVPEEGATVSVTLSPGPVVPQLFTGIFSGSGTGPCEIPENGTLQVAFEGDARVSVTPPLLLMGMEGGSFTGSWDATGTATFSGCESPSAGAVAASTGGQVQGQVSADGSVTVSLSSPECTLVGGGSKTSLQATGTCSLMGGSGHVILDVSSH